MSFTALQNPEHLSSWLDLIWVNQIEPLFSQGLHFIQEFHISQAALAVTDKHPYPHAKRFECYLHGCEIANGYWELIDTELLEKRFSQYTGKHRVVTAKDIEGMPHCAGVSVGIDRLFAILLGRSKL